MGRSAEIFVYFIFFGGVERRRMRRRGRREREANKRTEAEWGFFFDSVIKFFFAAPATALP